VSYPTAEVIRAALNDPNVKAFCEVIYKGETGRDPNPYARLNTPINGDFYIHQWVHPWHGQTTTTVGHSTACGRAQFLGTTWAEVADEYGLSDFSPPNQDFGTVARIAYRGALTAVLKGRFLDAVALCRKEWTSLPGAAENRKEWNQDVALTYYLQHGGALDTQEPAPIVEAGVPIQEEEEAMPQALGTAAAVAGVVNPGAGLLLGLANSLIDAFTPLAREKIKSRLGPKLGDPEVAGKFADALLGTAKQLTGQADPIQATVAAASNPAVMQKLESNALAELDKLIPFLDKLASYEGQEWAASEDSMDRAAARASINGWDMAPPLVWWALGAATIILVSLFALVAVYAYRGQPVPEMLLTLTVQVVTGILGFVALIFAFRFGTSRSSGAKDELMRQLVVRRA